MNFLKTIQNSIYSPSFYSNILQKTFKQALGYFLLLILILTVLHSVTFIRLTLIEAPTQIQAFIQSTIDCFPKELEVKVNNGQVATNVSEPYFIAFCGSSAKNQPMVVIDTKTSFSATQFDQYKTPIWITKDAVFIKERNSSIRSYALNRINKAKIDKDVLNSFSDKISPWLKFVGPVLFLVAFILIYSGYNFRLIYLLLLAAIILLLSKLFKRELTFGQSYKVGLFTITLGLIVELFVNLVLRWTYLYHFPFMVTIITLGVVIANLFIPRESD